MLLSILSILIESNLLYFLFLLSREKKRSSSVNILLSVELL